MPFVKGVVPAGSTPFEPGQSGNPDGRPPGSFSFKVIAEKILDGKITVEQAGEIRQMTRKEKMILEIIQDACNDEDPAVRLRATAFIIERTEGKVPDKLEHSGDINMGLVAQSAGKIKDFLKSLDDGNGEG